MIQAALQVIKDSSTGQTVGYEALAREVYGNPPMPNVPGVFARNATPWDWRMIDLKMVDYLCRHAVYRPLSINTLFINVAAETLAETFAWRMWLAGLDILIDRWSGPVAVEFSERLAADACDLDARLADVRDRGGLTAMDDVDGQVNSLYRLCAHDWDIAKIDWRPGARDDCPVEDIVKHCRERGIRTVLEGVETPLDISYAQRFGVDAIQGFGIGRPFLITR